MESFLVFIVVMYIFGTMLVTNAAKEHGCDMLRVVLASLAMSPIGGLLYVLCFRIREGKQSFLLKIQHEFGGNGADYSDFCEKIWIVLKLVLSLPSLKK